MQPSDMGPREEEMKSDASMAYEKRGGFADTTGQDYEVDICSLLLLRGMRLCSDLFLATNHGKAGAFDDAVLVYRLHDSDKYRAILLQAKHKKFTKIVPKTLLGTKNDFSLVKYFASYLAVRGNWASVTINGEVLELEEVIYVLYTNAWADLRESAFDVTEFASHRHLCELLLTGGHMVQIAGGENLSPAEPSDGKKFLQNMVLCYGQMDRDSASRYLDDEIRLVLNSRGENASKVRERMTNLMKEWWAQPTDVFYVTKKSALWNAVVIGEMHRLNERITQLNDELALTFTQRCLEQFTSKLQTSKRLALVVSDGDEASFARLKLYQSTEGRLVIVDGEELETNLREAMGVWKTPFCDVLVVDATSGLPLEDILSIISEDQMKTLVVITKEDIDIEDWVIWRQRTLWNDLDIHCTKNLESCQINLQGSKFSLKDYATRDPSVFSVLSAKHILHLAGKPNDIILGKHLAEGVPYYVPRQLERMSCILDSFFDELKGETCIITVLAELKDEVEELMANRFIVYSYDDIISREKIDISCVVHLDRDTHDSQFSELCAKYQCPIFVLQVREGELVYLQSRNGLTTVRKHLKEKVSERIHLDWDTRVRHVVVEGIPGIGKSCFMSWLGKKLKAANDHDWVVRIDLGKYTDIIRNMEFNSVEDIRDFIEKTSLAKDDASGVEKALFRHALEVTGNVTLLFDAFDEISPDYTAKCLRLLENLNISVKYRQMVVTTRPVTRQEVEDVLGTLAFTVPGFSKEEQLSFIKNYCTSKSINITERGIYSMISGVGRCMEVPLLALLAAEGLLNDDYTPGQDFVVYGKVRLYEIFIQRQIGIFLSEKHGLSPTTAFQKEIFDNIKSSLTEKLMTLAVKTLLSAEELEEVGFRGAEDELAGSKIGLVVSSEDRVHFVHHTFAEFFLGVWLSKNFKDCVNFLQRKFFEVNFEFVRESFNNYLHRDLPLQTAVAEEDVLSVERLVSEGVEVSTTDAGGRTPLHVAAMTSRKDRAVWHLITDAETALVDQKDCVFMWSALTYAEALSNWDAVDFLLSKGASVRDLRIITDIKNAKSALRDSASNGLVRLTLTLLKMHEGLLNKPLDYLMHTVLHCASASGNARLVLELVKTGANMDALNVGRFTAMCIAAEKGYVDVVAVLHKQGASMDAGVATPLHFATVSNCTEVVKYLTGEGNKSSDETETALIMAAKQNQLATVKELLDAGADVEERDARGLTALHWASTCGNAEVVKLLVGAGADVEARSNEGYTPIMWASMLGYNNAVQALLSAGADVNNCTELEGYTALNVAAYQGHAHTVQLLLRAGAELNRTNKMGRTALLGASFKGNRDVVQLLLREGASVHVESDNGGTALLAASFMGHAEVAQMLINAGADVNYQDQGGKTALLLATVNGHREVAQVLTSAGATPLPANKLEQSLEVSQSAQSQDDSAAKVKASERLSVRGVWKVLKKFCQLRNPPKEDQH